MKEEKRRKPWIGFVGMIALLIGLCMAFSNQPNITPGCIVSTVGGVVLSYALATGNVKLFG